MKTPSCLDPVYWDHDLSIIDKKSFQRITVLALSCLIPKSMQLKNDIKIEV